MVIAAYAVVGIVLIYAVLMDVGHQLVHLPHSARRSDVDVAAVDQPTGAP